MTGFMLSPLSWWNDAFLNLPLALTFAWRVSAVCMPPWNEFAFEVSMVAGYWVTNVVVVGLPHHGMRQLLAKSGTPLRQASFTRTCPSRSATRS